MRTFISNYWWAVWGAVVSLLFIRSRFLKTGTEEPFFRRIIYSFLPSLDPSSEKYQKLRIGIVIFAIVGVALAMIANILLYLNKN
jgi:hypothetical protein